MDERLKSILIWGAVIVVVIGLRLLADYVLVIMPPPHVEEFNWWTHNLTAEIERVNSSVLKP